LKGIDYFRQAIDVDPNYALAHAGLGDAYVVLGAWNVLPSKEAFPKARAAASSALELDNTLSEAHATLGFVYDSFDWDWNKSEREYKRAIKNNPTYATAHEWYALCLSHTGQHDEAISRAKHAQQLDPLTPIISTVVGLVHHYARQYDEAIKECQAVIEMDPTFLAARYFCGCAYTQLGKHEQAVAMHREVVRMSDRAPLGLAMLGNALAVSGNPEPAQEVLSELQGMVGQKYVSPFFETLILAGLGQTDQALEKLGEAVEERFHRIASIVVEPMLDPLRSDPRFKTLMKRVGLFKSKPARTAKN